MKLLTETSWNAYSNQMKVECAARRIPQSGTFELTPLCNFKCSMCYIRLDPEQMSGQGRLRTAGEWLDLGRQALSAGTLFLLITGGEPLARPDFCRIYDGLSEMGFVLILFTNGYMFNDELIIWLSKCPPTKLRITLYGMTDETYQKVCGIRDGFTVVSRNIKKLLAAGLPLSLAMTVIKDNESDFHAARIWAEELGVEFRYTREIVKPVRGATSRAESVRFQAGNMSEKISRSIHPTKALFPMVNNDPLSICGGVDRSFWVTWDGRMSLCTYISSICEHPFEDGLLPAWDRLCDRVRRLKRPVKCIDCVYQKFCVVCPGALEAETGDPEMFDESFCTKAKRRYQIYGEGV